MPARRDGAGPVGPRLLVACLTAAPFLIVDRGFYEVFLWPKVALVWIAVSAGLCWQVFRGRLVAPRWPWLLAAAVVAGLLGVRGPDRMAALVQWSTWLALLLAWLVALNLPPKAKAGLSDGILAAAVIATILSLNDLLHGGGSLTGFDDEVRPAAIGPLGNAEFFATLLGAGVVLAWGRLHEKASGRWSRMALAAVIGLLLVGIALARSKGTLGLLGLLAVGWYFRSWKPAAGLALAGGVFAALSRSDSIQGRIFLWLCSGRMLVDALPFGAGFDGFHSRYLPAAHDLLAGHPALAARFGSYTGDVRDAHNVALDLAVALGLPGLLIACGLLVVVLRRALRERGAVGGVLLLLAAKLLYTVVLGSITGGWLLALLLAAAWPAAGQPFRLRASARVLLLLVALAGPLLVLPAAVADLRYARGMRALYLSDLADADRSFTAAVRADPADAEARLSLAFIAFQRHDRAAMEEDITAAIRLCPTVDIMKRGAHMYFHSRMFAKAEPLYRWLMEAFPDRRSAIVKLAQVRLAVGDRAEAVRLARKAIAMQPRVYNPNDVRYLQTAQRILNHSPGTPWRLEP